MKENPEIWDAAFKTWFRFKVESIPDTYITGDAANIGGWLYKNIWAKPSQRKLIQAAMPEHYSKISTFMEDIRRTGIIFGKESRTAVAAEDIAELKRAGTPAVARWLEAPRAELRRRIAEVFRGRYYDKLMDEILSPRGFELLKRAQSVSPGGTKFLNYMGTFFGNVMGQKWEPVTVPKKGKALEDATRRRN
ncbi:MAG: hypothetical protein GWN30_27515 [Gammaproteobacteria bacterium]|nr:hypothetical protein [Gammaproteobacteria bacterium]